MKEGYKIYIPPRLRKDKYIVVVLAENRGNYQEHILFKDGTPKYIIEEGRQYLENFYEKKNIRVLRMDRGEVADFYKEG